MLSTRQNKNTITTIHGRFHGSSRTFFFSGPPGCGKTTAAYALAEQRNANVLFINASKDTSIDILRNEIYTFVQTRSLGFEDKSGKKIIILDEADGMSSNLQNGLKSAMEDLSSVCEWILTTNNPQKIIEPIHSRSHLIHFTFTKSDSTVLCRQMFARCSEILKNEDIKFDNDILARLVFKLYPDFRKTINVIQAYAASGTIDVGVLTSYELDIAPFLEAVKSKDMKAVKEWVRQNMGSDIDTIYRKVWDVLGDYVDGVCMPELTLLCYEFKRDHHLVADPEISITTFAMSMAGMAKWKN